MADLLQCSLTQPLYYIGTIDLRFESKVGHIYVCMYVSARYWSIDKMRANTHTYNYVYKWWSNAISIRDNAGQNRLINLMATNTPNDHKDSPFLVPAILCRKFFFAATLLSKTGEISIDILYNAVFMFFVPPGVALLLDNKRCILYFTLIKLARNVYGFVFI